MRKSLILTKLNLIFQQYQTSLQANERPVLEPVSPGDVYKAFDEKANVKGEQNLTKSKFVNP